MKWFLNKKAFCLLILFGFMDPIANADDHKQWVERFKKQYGNYKSGARFGDWSCESKDRPTLVLIDTTDSFDKKSAQLTEFLDLIKGEGWLSEGESFTFVKLGKEPIPKMHAEMLCAPKPASKINDFFDPVAKIKKHNKKFQKSVSVIVENIAKSYEQSPDTMLLEAINAVYTSNRFKAFNQATKRRLIIASDLYQHSEGFSLIRACRTKCPNLESTLSANLKISKYLTSIRPKLSSDDEIIIYRLRRKNKNNPEDWWQDYFKETGLKSKEVKVLSSTKSS